MSFVEFPIFDDVPCELPPWISWMEDFFVREDFKALEKLNLAQSVLEGEALIWFQWRQSLWFFHSWETMKEDLLLRFGDDDDPEKIRLNEKNKRLLQQWRENIERRDSEKIQPEATISVRPHESFPVESEASIGATQLIEPESLHEIESEENEAVPQSQCSFLHLMASFDGPKFQMTDGSCVQTKAIDVGSSTDISPYLSLLRKDSILNGNRVVIFDVYWDIGFLKTGTKKSGWSLSSVKLSTRNLCLFLRLPKPFHDNIKDLYRFFASKFVTFVGVQIEEDLNLLRENHGLVIRNAIEIGKLAARARGTLVLEFLGTRELAHRVLWCDLSRLDSIEANWEETGSEERIEAAAIEGWLIFNVWDQLSQ